MMTTTQANINHDNWTLYDAHGYQQQRGVQVRRYPACGDTCETVSIGIALHRAEELEISEHRIQSLAGWYLIR